MRPVPSDKQLLLDAGTVREVLSLAITDPEQLGDLVRALAERASTGADNLQEQASVYCHKFCHYRLQHENAKRSGLPDECDMCPIGQFTLTTEEMDMSENPELPEKELRPRAGKDIRGRVEEMDRAPGTRRIRPGEVEEVNL